MISQRPIWRGHLRLALVTCPIALYTARHDRSTIRFNMLNPATGNRIKMVSQDAVTGEPISRGETVKGYEYEKNRYIVVSDEDMEAVKVESSSVMVVEKFVDAGSIDPVYYDASYFLAPDGKVGEDVYAVLKAAIEEAGKVALTRVVISQRERTVALRPMAGGLVAHTLNEDRDLNAAAPLFAPIRAVTPDPAMVDLARQLIQRQSGTYDPADLEDRYETRLRAMLDAKIRGQADAPVSTAAPDSNVIDLMAALRKSLGEPAKAVPPAAAPKRSAKKVQEARAQPGLKLPIAGGKPKEVAVEQVQAAPPSRTRRRA